MTQAPGVQKRGPQDNPPLRWIRGDPVPLPLAYYTNGRTTKQEHGQNDWTCCAPPMAPGPVLHSAHQCTVVEMAECEALSAPACGGGREGAVRKGTTVQFSPTEQTFPSRLGTSNVEKSFKFGRQFEGWGGGIGDGQESEDTDNTTQHNTAQHNSTAQHSTAQHSTAQHSTARHGTAQHRPVGAVPLCLWAHSRATSS